MDREQTRAAIRVMQGHLDCKKIQYRGRNGATWWHTEEYRWDWDENEYRIKPKSTIRQWTMEECPVGEVLVRKLGGPKVLIISAYTDSCSVGGDGAVGYETLLDKYRMANGDPCGVREEGDS